MKQSRILLIFVAVLAILIVVGCSNNQPATVANGDTTQGNQDNPPQDNVQATEAPNVRNMTIINVSPEGAVIGSNAMSIEAAVQVGLQYIYDIFGERIADMYIDMEFSEWEHLTRPLWHGAVSDNLRNTVENRARISELNDKFMARLDAGEESEDVFEDMSELFGAVSYSPARFYFFIDAITGERIDIWKTSPARMQVVDESIQLHEYIDQKWDGDWDAAFEVDISPEEIYELGQIARAYAQRQFNNAAIADMNFENAFQAFTYSGGGFIREPYANFSVTNDAGRIAWVSISVEHRRVSSINTMSNDVVPMDMYEGARRVERE